MIIFKEPEKDQKIWDGMANTNKLISLIYFVIITWQTLAFLFAAYLNDHFVQNSLH